MPLCGFNKKMLYGLALFAQSLYETALRRSKEKKISVEEAMNLEIKEMKEFLFAVDKRYEHLRKTDDVPTSMKKLVSWIEKKEN